jgi:hypothetical protein
MTRKTLKERIGHRWVSVTTAHGHVRAELDRLARQVRRLAENRSHMPCAYTRALSDVLQLIRDCKR